jgi:hypothetical protein
MQNFENPSSARHNASPVAAKAHPGVCLPGYHYIDPVTGAKTPAMLQVPHPSTPMVPPLSATNPSLLNVINSSRGNTASAETPLVFLQGQPQQFLPQQGREDTIFSSKILLMILYSFRFSLLAKLYFAKVLEELMIDKGRSVKVQLSLCK